MLGKGKSSLELFMGTDFPVTPFFYFSLSAAGKCNCKYCLLRSYAVTLQRQKHPSVSRKIGEGRLLKFCSKSGTAKLVCLIFTQ